MPHFRPFYCLCIWLNIESAFLSRIVIVLTDKCLLLLFFILEMCLKCDFTSIDDEEEEELDAVSKKALKQALQTKIQAADADEDDEDESDDEE